jgi:hypothetical protein
LTINANQLNKTYKICRFVRKIQTNVEDRRNFEKEGREKNGKIMIPYRQGWQQKTSYVGLTVIK